MVESQPAMIDVHVVEDHPVYRGALVNVINATDDMRVGVAVGSVEEFAGYRARPGGIVSLDLKLPGASDAEAVAAVTALGFQVLVLSAYGGRAEVLGALAAGARGYLTKDADIDDVRLAVRVVAAGDRYLSPTLAGYLLDAPRLLAYDNPFPLSERERQVLALLADGERDQDIAKALSISVRTVRSHLDRIREKTGRRRRPELTRLAIEKGIVRYREDLLL
ncbi:LuxR C-terminal-related transcriptional regulator [Rugosimonospora africana]|uniref:DNA-binding response regulator n=1 Tax=Rugosimonospora africana TaxID=556532 RepID=A0A8J3VVU4_9ACTN|nr:response regulator transcription factor [Rugosimonospora africana]GIH21042.1 DNA-binding response regulator [Rugosimonospora africana]